MRIGPTLVLLAALLAVSGCGSDAEPSGGSEPSGGAGSTLSDTLVYSRGGGIAGRSFKLTLRPGGGATLEAPGMAAKDVTVEATDVSAVADALKDADLPSLRSTYAPDTPRPDGFGHRVEVGGKTVDVADGSDAPQPLKVLVGRLSTIVDATKG